jgi:protein-L-isoaspartate(D-aspartate) O-methyltransferase
MTFDFRAARLNMVESQVRTADVTDLNITDAFRAVPRETLVPSDKAGLAYADVEVEYAPGLYLMRPREIGKLLQTLHPQALERAVCIAAPYAAAVLETMGLKVTQVDAGATLPAGEFDVVLSEGAVAETPDSWVAALADGGRLGVVVRGARLGKTHLYLREGDRISSREVFDATPPYLPGHEPKPSFAF